MGCNRTLTRVDLDQMLADLELDDNSAVDESVLRAAVGPYIDSTNVSLLATEYADQAEYLNAVLACLAEINHIPGSDAIIDDLLAGGSKAQGADFQLEYVVKHRDTVAAISEPDAMTAVDGHIYGREGLDVVFTDGSVAELKDYNLASHYYVTNALSVAAKLAQQAERHLRRGASNVSIVFSGAYGPAPAELAEALNAALGERHGIGWTVE